MSVRVKKRQALGDRGAQMLMRPTQPKLRIGVIGNEAVTEHGMGSGLTVAEIATIHEFGTQRIPRRSWLRDYVDGNKARIEVMLRNVAKRGFIAGLGSTLETFGVVMVGEIQDRISDRIPPPLSSRTKSRKGSDVPLVDTGQLRSSITYQVVQ